MTGLVLSLFDLTGNMVKPWADAGYETLCIDIQRDGTDILRWLPPRHPPPLIAKTKARRWMRAVPASPVRPKLAKPACVHSHKGAHMRQPKFTEKEWSAIRDCISSVAAGAGDTRPWSDDADKREVARMDAAFERVLSKLNMP